MLVLVLPPVSSRVSGFPVASPCLWGEAAKTCPFVMLPTVKKLPEVSHKMLVFLYPRVLSRGACFSVASPCLWGKLENLSFFECFQAGCHVVLRGRRGTFWHSNLLDDVHKIAKFEEVSHEMLFFSASTCLVCVSRFPVASSCLWGKSQNLSFSNVSKQVVMSFCMAGVALCDIPTCLITCRKC